MTTPDRPKPIPGATPGSVVTDRILVNGNCPICESSVLWAADRRENLDGSAWHAPLDPHPIPSWEMEQGLARVLISSTGQAAVIESQLHRLHLCPREAVEEVLRRLGAMGDYTADVLRTPCPVRSCGAAPGMLCLSQRREALPRPHGARSVASRGEDLDEVPIV